MLPDCPEPPLSARTKFMVKAPCIFLDARTMETPATRFWAKFFLVLNHPLMYWWKPITTMKIGQSVVRNGVFWFFVLRSFDTREIKATAVEPMIYSQYYLHQYCRLVFGLYPRVLLAFKPYLTIRKSEVFGFGSEEDVEISEYYRNQICV